MLKRQQRLVPWWLSLAICWALVGLGFSYLIDLAVWVFQHV
jgi:hypothetical protein